MKTALLLLSACLAAFSQNIDYSRVRNGPGLSVNAYGMTGNSGFSAAYAALPSTGGALVLTNDISITAPTVMSVVSDKGFSLDLQGHTITCRNISGACLSFTHVSGGNTPVQVFNGTIAYAGSSTGVTGVQVTGMADYLTLSLTVKNFTTSGSYCAKFSDAENIHVSLNCQNNYNGLLFTNFSTNILIQHTIIENQSMSSAGVPVRIEQQSSGLTFDQVLLQTTHTTHGVEVDSTVGGIIAHVRWKNSWFENVGDGTANSRVFWFSSNASHQISHFVSEDNEFNSDTLGALGTVFEFTGDNSAVVTFPRIVNSVTSYAHFLTGTQVFPLFVLGDNTEFCDVCINRGNLPGIYWFPQTGGHQYHMWAGDSAQLGDANNWTFRDETAGVNPMHYVSSTQTMTFIGTVAAPTIAATGNVTAGQDIVATRDVTAGRSLASISGSGHTWALRSEFSRTDSDLDIYLDGVLMARFNASGYFGIGGGNAAIKSPLQIQGIPVYANNAAAITGGLVVGSFYRTGADPDPILVVH